LKAIADTGFLVAFANCKDRYHEWALAIAEQVTDPLLTCEAVIAEASFHLQNTWLVLAMINEGLIRPAFNLIHELTHLLELAHRYRDRKPDLADLCIIRMSELYPAHSVITVDVNDFRVYRRNKRERIPIISPE
jgi:predicted nucleic acid-binding protein